MRPAVRVVVPQRQIVLPQPLHIANSNVIWLRKLQHHVVAAIAFKLEPIITFNGDDNRGG